MKKAIVYMAIGALAVACTSMYMDSNCKVACKMKEMKKVRKQAMDKIVAIW